MNKSCWSCKHCIIDYFATGTMDCIKQDDMTEEEFENYYENNGGENCIYYEPIMTDKEIEAEEKMLLQLLDKRE